MELYFYYSYYFYAHIFNYYYFSTIYNPQFFVVLTNLIKVMAMAATLLVGFTLSIYVTQKKFDDDITVNSFFQSSFMGKNSWFFFLFFFPTFYLKITERNVELLNFFFF